METLRLLDMAGAPLADLVDALPPSFATPTLTPPCPDTAKYAVVARLAARLAEMAAEGARLGSRRIRRILTVNGARAELEGGGFALVRASSNTPNLVVICESLTSEAERDAIEAALMALVSEELRAEARDAPL